MKDERDELLDNLFRTARTMKPDTAAVEEHFETRLMASIGERRNSQELWSFWIWRLVPVFSAMVIVLGIGSVFMDPGTSNDLSSLFINGYEEYLTTSLIAGG